MFIVYALLILGLVCSCHPPRPAGDSLLIPAAITIALLMIARPA